MSYREIRNLKPNIMSNYRIVVKTNAEGNKTYYLQKRFLNFFWRYEKKYYGGGWYERFSCGTLDMVDVYLSNKMEILKERKKRQTVKTEYIYRTI